MQLINIRLLALVGLCGIVLLFLLHAWQTANTIPTSTVGISNDATSTREITSTNSFPTSGETFSSTTPSKPAGPDSSTAVLLQGMKMTFDDEFTSFSRYVDANGNTTCNTGGAGTWQTVYDFCSRTNPGNDEAEVYTDPSFYAYLKKETNAEAEVDPENPFSVQGGVLDIKAAPSSAQVVAAVGPWAQYTSGIITTQFSFSQEYGYFEMRAKLPAGKGLWPAFWLLPDDQSWPPEIDALEAFGDTSSTGEGGGVP